MILIQTSLLNLQYIVHARPLLTRQANKLETFDEYVIGLILILNYILIDVSQAPSIRSFQGWVMIAVASTNLLFHFAMLFKDTFNKLRI